MIVCPVPVLVLSLLFLSLRFILRSGLGYFWCYLVLVSNLGFVVFFVLFFFSLKSVVVVFFVLCY